MESTIPLASNETPDSTICGCLCCLSTIENFSHVSNRSSPTFTHSLTDLGRSDDGLCQRYTEIKGNGHSIGGGGLTKYANFVALQHPFMAQTVALWWLFFFPF